MATSIEKAPRPSWFVGAMYGGHKDQTERFLKEGLWENGYEDKYLDLVRCMQPGDRIAIKSTYTRKRDLPFDNLGNSVSVMAIKAIGTIRGNQNDGKRVIVDWTERQDQREWYFYTYRQTIWRVFPSPEDWMPNNLLDFTFEGIPQEIDRFCNHPYWSDRFGQRQREKRFLWPAFYEAVAEKLLNYQFDRKHLIEGIHEIATRVDGLSYLQDRFTDGTKGPLQDICPFTTMGIFNRNITEQKRKIIAKEIAKLVDVETDIPDLFEGIPCLNNQNSWFFGYSDKRKDGDIDALWKVFAAAAELIDSDLPEHRAEFTKAYDSAMTVSGVAWNLSIGLHWAHPWHFPTLDQSSRDYMKRHLGLQTPGGERKPCNSEEYLELIDELDTHFKLESYSVHSFPEMSLASYRFRNNPATTKEGTQPLADREKQGEQPKEIRTVSSQLYSIDDILSDGCFLSRNEIERFLERLRSKKNLILQGPPGTGKTWIAKRLAFALVGERDNGKVRAVQFHPSLSYEDFVRGWRPDGSGKLTLTDGLFMESVRAASKDPSSEFVVVIEEINRGNPAQIFGELLTLLEAGKRTSNEGLNLCYSDGDGERTPIHIPENLYVIGTMNIADRSLALVDFAFRRRFAFVTLEPKLGDRWREWIVERYGIDPELVPGIERRINDLNLKIGENLGTQFRIGHSYVTPTQPIENGSTRDWFIQISETEIRPLLEEYWFDSPKTAQEALDALLEGW